MRVIAKSSVVLIALVPLTLVACSNGSSSSTSTASASGRDSVVTTPSTSRPNSVSTTVQTVPRQDTTSIAVLEVPTTLLGPTLATSPAGVAGNSPPAQATATPSLPTPAGEVALIDKDCTAENTDSGYDLLHVRVEPVLAGYRLAARYSGDTFQHDILISFDLGASSYVVTAELFEDGQGVARVVGRDSSEAVFLDPPQTITAGLVELTVRNDQISGLSGTAFDIAVSLKVDGSDIESCQD